MCSYLNIDILEGNIITDIEGMEEGSTEVYFTVVNNGVTTKYLMYHEQDCCESVYLADVCGDVSDLLNALIVHAEERSESGESSDWGTATYTFYDIQTTKGCVNLRWVGESNGYYSEDVSFVKVED